MRTGGEEGRKERNWGREPETKTEKQNRGTEG
jgi:hypothetical protein